MPEIQLGAHTIRSHGVAVARFHMHDWLILVLLIVIEVVLNVIEPFHRFVGEDMLTDLRYPLQDNTVPFWAVPVISYLWIFLFKSITLWGIYSYYSVLYMWTVDSTCAPICCHFCLLLHQKRCLWPSSCNLRYLFQCFFDFSDSFQLLIFWGVFMCLHRFVVLCTHNRCHNRCY